MGAEKRLHLNSEKGGRCCICDSAEQREATRCTFFLWLKRRRRRPTTQGRLARRLHFMAPPHKGWRNCEKKYQLFLNALYNRRHNAWALEEVGWAALVCIPEGLSSRFPRANLRQMTRRR